MAVVKRLDSGHVVEEYDDDETREFRRLWGGHDLGFVRLLPGPIPMPSAFPAFHSRIFNFQFVPSDVLIVTYPKCGTTWMQEIVYTLRNNPDLDNPMASIPINSRVPFMEYDALIASKKNDHLRPGHPMMESFRKLVPNGNPDNGMFIQICESMAHPRTIKTHLPFSLLPKDTLDKAKVIYVLRNPKDALISFLQFARLMKGQDFLGTLDEFVELYLDSQLAYGSYATHLIEAFERKGHPNLCIVRYEDLKRDTLSELKKIDSFLGTNRTPEQLNNTLHYTSFEEMKKRDSHSGDKMSDRINMEHKKKEGGFYRKGVTGSWKEKLSSENSAKIDAWVEKNLGNLAEEFRYS